MLNNTDKRGNGVDYHNLGNRDGMQVVEVRSLEWLYLSAIAQDDMADASEPLMLVDLSDAANFPHDSDYVASVWLKRVILDADLQGDWAGTIKLGVVKESDGTDGSVDWIYKFQLESVDNPTDSTRGIHQVADFTVDPRGLSLLVASSALSYVVTNESTDDSALWNTGVSITSPVGTAAPGAGDLVALLERTSGSGTITYRLNVLYSTD
jgi:hypothetical protein